MEIYEKQEAKETDEPQTPLLHVGGAFAASNQHVVIYVQRSNYPFCARHMTRTNSHSHSLGTNFLSTPKPLARL
jgi:hypothetical protein